MYHQQVKVTHHFSFMHRHGSLDSGKTGQRHQHLKSNLLNIATDKTPNIYNRSGSTFCVGKETKDSRDIDAVGLYHPKRMHCPCPASTQAHKENPIASGRDIFFMATTSSSSKTVCSGRQCSISHLPTLGMQVQS